MKKPISRQANEDNLKYVAKLFEEIDYFVSFGTLLGLVRDGRLIPGDDDVDIYVSLEDRGRVLGALEQSEFSWDFGPPLNHTNYFVQLTRPVQGEVGLVDLYFFEFSSNGNYLHERWNYFGDVENVNRILKIDKSLVFPLGEFELEGVKIKLPGNRLEMVKYYYGHRWKFPLKKGSEYRTRLVNNKPRIFVGRWGRFERRVFRILGKLNLIRYG